MGLRRSRWVLWVLGGLWACAPTVPPAYLDALAAGDRALSAGRFREAAEAYERAARAADRDRDRAEADYRAGRVRARLGDRDRALAHFDRVAMHSPDFERGARAAYEAARLRLDDPATRELALAALDALVRTRARTGPARRAVTVLLREDDARDPTGTEALRRIDGWLAVEAVRASSLHETLLAERAHHLERAGHDDEAVHTWRSLFETVPHPQNSRWDDGHMALARLLRRRGDPRGALAVLDAMLAPRDPACTGGSCDAPYFQEGAMLRGEILRDDLHDPLGAARAFREVYEGFPTSRVRDDALEAEARALEQVGDARACAVWTELAETFPCTRRGRTARARASACGRTPLPHAGSCR